VSKKKQITPEELRAASRVYWFAFLVTYFTLLGVFGLFWTWALAGGMIAAIWSRHRYLAYEEGEKA
jgi:hypothetical protein